MKLILIRHGLTDYNLKKRYCGLKDVVLNKKGKEVAKLIKNRLKDIKVDKVFCSDLKRSCQTAKIIFGDRKCAIAQRPNLREIDFGKWEGLNFKEINKKYPRVYRKWLSNPFSVNIPSGEDLRHFVSRVKKEFKNIFGDNPDKTIAIVGHAGSMRVILNSVLGLKRKDFWKIELNPEAVYIVEYHG